MKIVNFSDSEQTQTMVEFPSGSVPLDSNFYIERPPIEQLIYQEISKPGSIIRIKAPGQMGKTSLLLRVLDRAEKMNYRTAYIDFLQADRAIFESLDKFLRWFCANLSRQLELKPMLDDYWDEDVGSKINSTIYLQSYLLEQIDAPVVLALNEVNQIFEHLNTAQEFLSLLRSWYEQAKKKEIWQKLRFVLVHSTEVYISFNINQSPFNVGHKINLPEFDLEQVVCLAGRHGLDWSDETAAKKLMSLVGGHPYLVRLALYHLVSFPQKSLDRLLKEASTLTGIYSEHLREHLEILQKNPGLGAAFKQVIMAEGGVKLDPIVAYKLESMGLVKLEGDRITLACKLYRQYFADQNLGEDLQNQVEQLQKQVQLLEELSRIDDITQVANRRYFELYLKQLWQVAQMTPLSLIVCEIDFFRIYNDNQGSDRGDECLRQVGNAIRECVKSKSSLVARYRWEKFAVVLPGIEVKSAFQVAEEIRNTIKELTIPYNLSQMGGFPSPIITLSVGVASTIPTEEKSPEILINAADEARYEARRNGRDRTEISSSLNYKIP